MSQSTKSKQLFERRKERVRHMLRRQRDRKRDRARVRLSVFRSGKHIYAQVIDDTNGVTLAAASTGDKELKGKAKSGASIEAAKSVGLLIAARAKALNVSAVVFDRGGYLFHGRVKALADGAREGGLEF